MWTERYVIVVKLHFSISLTTFRDNGKARKDWLNPELSFLQCFVSLPSLSPNILHLQILCSSWAAVLTGDLRLSIEMLKMVPNPSRLQFYVQYFGDTGRFFDVNKETMSGSRYISATWSESLQADHPGSCEAFNAIAKEYSILATGPVPSTTPEEKDDTLLDYAAKSLKNASRRYCREYDAPFQE